MSRGTVSALLLLAGFVALAAFSVFAQQRDATRMPDGEELVGHASVLAAGWRDGDAVRPLPAWFDTSRTALGDRPYLLATPLDPLERYRFQRVWFLAAGGAPLTDADLAWVSEPELVHETDRARLYVANVEEGPDVRWDGLAALADASVHRGETACTTWLDGGWHCGRYHEFLYVGAAMREMDEQPRRCISANAPERGEAWSIVWEDVPAGDRLVVRAGNTFDAVRALRGSEVRFEVLVDEVPVLEHRFHPDATGYPSFEIDSIARDGTFRLEVRVAADDHLDRLFCFRPQVQAGAAI